MGGIETAIQIQNKKIRLIKNTKNTEKNQTYLELNYFDYWSLNFYLFYELFSMIATDDVDTYSSLEELR